MDDSKLKYNWAILGLCKNILSELKGNPELSLGTREFAIKQFDYLYSLIDEDI